MPASSVASHTAICFPTDAVDRPGHPPPATPDVASLAWSFAWIGPCSSTRFGETVGAITGAVASRLIVTSTVRVPPSDVAWQVNVVPVVSAETVWSPQPLWSTIWLSGSLTAKLTVGLPVYQPFAPSGEDGSTDGVITGASRSTAPPATIEPPVMYRTGEQFMHSQPWPGSVRVSPWLAVEVSGRYSSRYWLVSPRWTDHPPKIRCLGSASV